MNEGNNESDKSNRIVVTAVVIAVVVFAVVGVIYFMNQGSENGVGDKEKVDYSTFANENYGLSFLYPSSWSVDNYKYYGILVVTVLENYTSESPRAQAQIYAGSLGYPSLDNLEGQIAGSVENNENMSMVGEVERVKLDGNSGIDVSYTSAQENYDVRSRMRVIKKDNFEYSITYSSKMKYYEELQSELDHIIESFALL